MGLVDQVVGALAIGSWTNIMLYSLELTQMYKYFTTYRNDHWLLKGVVVIALLSDTVGSISNCVAVYRYVITKFGNMANLGVQGPEFPIYLTTSTVSAAICHFYLIHRYYRLTKQIWVTGLLTAVASTAKGCALYTDYALTAYSSLAQRSKLVTSATTWLSAEFSADVLIAASLIIYLASYTKTSFSETRMLLYRLIFIAAESGVFTTLIAIAALATFLTAQETNVCVGIAWNLGRAYTLTLLLNLGIRKNSSLTGDSATSKKSSGRVFNYPLSDVSNTLSRRPDFEGVTVDHHTQIHVEEDIDHKDPVEVQFVIDETSSEHKSQRGYSKEV